MYLEPGDVKEDVEVGAVVDPESEVLECGVDAVGLDCPLGEGDACGVDQYGVLGNLYELGEELL